MRSWHLESLEKTRPTMKAWMRQPRTAWRETTRTAWGHSVVGCLVPYLEKGGWEEKREEGEDRRLPYPIVCWVSRENRKHEEKSLTWRRRRI